MRNKKILCSCATLSDISEGWISSFSFVQDVTMKFQEARGSAYLSIIWSWCQSANAPFALHAWYCTSGVARFELHVFLCTFCIARSALHVLHCTFGVAHFVLHVLYCTFGVACTALHRKSLRGSRCLRDKHHSKMISMSIYSFCWKCNFGKAFKIPQPMNYLMKTVWHAQNQDNRIVCFQQVTPVNNLIMESHNLSDWRKLGVVWNNCRGLVCTPLYIEIPTMYNRSAGVAASLGVTWAILRVVIERMIPDLPGSCFVCFNISAFFRSYNVLFAESSAILPQNCKLRSAVQYRFRVLPRRASWKLSIPLGARMKAFKSRTVVA